MKHFTFPFHLHLWNPEWFSNRCRSLDRLSKSERLHGHMWHVVTAILHWAVQIEQVPVALNPPPAHQGRELVFQLLFCQWPFWARVKNASTGWAGPQQPRELKERVWGCRFPGRGGTAAKGSSAMLPDTRGTVQRAGFRVQ